jgi:uncharacterized membrane protein (DUF485 family)
MESQFSSGSKSRPTEADWNRIAVSVRFQRLLAIKKIFIVPVFVFFLVYYLMLPILLGYAPGFMSMRVVGTVTLAYLFALSQFVVGWTIAWLYLRASSRFDKLVKDVLEKDVLENGVREDYAYGQHASEKHVTTPEERK